jgi:cation diffusion facilitator CzcD-associated flavoprotein CzcO
MASLILEQGEAVGTAWRRHYERLHLHTDKRHSALPFMPFPKHCPRYPSRQQVIDYLEAYARAFRLQPMFAQQVVAAGPAAGVWEVRTAERCYRAANLVVATGYSREPCIPEWPGRTLFRGAMLHSCAYRNAEPFRNQKVLVVGFGNSGGEIAIDLHEHGAQVSLAVRGPVNVVPREVLGVPVLTLGIAERRLPPRLADALNSLILRTVVGDLSRYGLRKLTDGPITRIGRDARVPIIDVGTLELIRRGAVAVRPGVAAFEEDGVIFGDGTRSHYDAVILATGYRPRVSAFLTAPPGSCDEHGRPRTSGRASAPGLYFCGYHVSPAGMLREIAREARAIAAAIVH